MPKAICSKCTKPAVARGLCGTHWMSWRRAQGDRFVSLYGDPERRFWENIDKRGPDDCWLWTGILEEKGYAHIKAGQRAVKVHRFAYELLVGPIPEGLEVDHTCHDRRKCKLRSKCPHRRCCNPAHLEPVKHRTNVERSGNQAADNMRKTRCLHDHPLSGDNLGTRGDGGRRCLTCKRESGRRSYAAKHPSVRPHWSRRVT